MPVPRMFVDRGMGSKIVPDGLRAAGWIVTTMDERYGFKRSQTLSDVEWIAAAAAAGEAILCKDRAVTRNALESEAIVKHGARVFVLPNATITGHAVVERLLAHEAGIFRWCERAGPFVVGVYPERLNRLRLNHPSG